MLLWDAVGRRHGWVDGNICGPVAALDGFSGKVVSAEAWCSWPCEGGYGVSASGGASSSAEGPSGAPGPEPLGPAALLATAATDGTVRVFDLLAIAALAGSAASGSKASQAAQAPLWELALPGGPSGGAELPAWSAAAMRQAVHERNRLALSPDGQRLAVAGHDRRILVLEAESGEQLAALAGHTAAVRALRWLAPDRLLSAAEDGSVRIWSLSP